MQRKWGTQTCPTKLDSLRAVLRFCYTRWNSRNPDDTYAMPSDETLQEYLDGLA